jgi:capsular polysaccharide biosynthesis protein
VGGVSRADVVQAFLSLWPSPRYLEIGVARGATFHAVEAAAKVAVDPQFRFDTERARAEHPNAAYHAVTSDAYFGQLARPGDRFEVIYLDGLHTVDQTLRDLTNALDLLAPDGVIVVDDVVPSSYSASLPDYEEVKALRAAVEREQSMAWMGDVYRLVFMVQSFFQNLSYRTVADNHGQLVLWRGRRAYVPERRIEDVARLPYERAMVDRAAFRFAPLADIVEELRARGGTGTAGTGPGEVIERATLSTAALRPREKELAGAVYDADGRLVKASQRTVQTVYRHVDPPVLDGAPPASVIAEALYLGHFFRHFGHFLVETLPALHWALDYDGTLVFHPWEGVTAAEVREREFIHESLRALGIEPERILIVGEPLGVERLLMPPRENYFEPRPEALEVYERIVRRLTDGGDGPARVYLSRRLWHKRVHPVNEHLAEAAFAAHGFRIVHPEQLPFREQVGLAAHAEVLAGLGGSALHLSCFMRPGTRTVVVGESMTGLRTLNTARGIDTVELRVTERGGEHAPRQLTIDIPELRRALAEHGF